VVDEQWIRAMEYVNSVSELNYMTQIVIMVYEDPTKVRIASIRRHHASQYTWSVIVATSARQLDITL